MKKIIHIFTVKRKVCKEQFGIAPSKVSVFCHKSKVSPVDSLGVLSGPVVRAKLGKERARDVLG